MRERKSLFAKGLRQLSGMFLCILLMTQCTSREREQAGDTTSYEPGGIVEFSPEEAYSARPDSVEARLRPKMMKWAEQFRQAALPLVSIFLHLESAEGFGETHCSLLYQLQLNLGDLQKPEDATLARLVRTFNSSLSEPVRLCQIWDPGPLASELLFIEQGLAVIDLNLTTYYGYQALPELDTFRSASGGRIEPHDLGGGEIRARYIRTQ
jgi:hypothetical protein